MTDQRNFSQLVRDALAHLHSTARLETHALQTVLDLERQAGRTRAQVLRLLLREAIGRLKPGPSVPFGHPAWLPYRTLWARYVQAKSPIEASLELGISRATFYRYHHTAIGALSNMLWSEHVLAATSSPPATSPLGAQARREARKLHEGALRERVDIAELMASVLQTVAPLAKQKDVVIAAELPDESPYLYADRGILRQMLLALITAMLEELGASEMTIMVEAKADCVEWTLLGMADEAAGKRLHARPGFYFGIALLALYDGVPAIEWENPGGPALLLSIPTKSCHKILLLDDDVDLLRLYRTYLQEHGFAPVTVSNPQAVDAALAQERPDLILLDVLMPQWDGWSILQRLKADPHTSDIPVVVCSVLPQPELALSLGAARVLQKPVSSAKLIETVQAVLAPGDS